MVTSLFLQVTWLLWSDWRMMQAINYQRTISDINFLQVWASLNDLLFFLWPDIRPIQK